jgi:hypothetical protein
VPARWLADPVALRRACENAVRTLLVLPTGKPSLRLLADETAKLRAGTMRAIRSRQSVPLGSDIGSNIGPNTDGVEAFCESSQLLRVCLLPIDTFGHAAFAGPRSLQLACGRRRISTYCREIPCMAWPETGVGRWPWGRCVNGPAMTQRRPRVSESVMAGGGWIAAIRSENPWPPVLVR